MMKLKIMGEVAMKYKKIIIRCIAGLIIVAIVFFNEKELINSYFSKVKLQYISKSMEENYLYDIDAKLNSDNICKGYLEALDNRDTYYLNSDELKVAKIYAKGNGFGTGLDLMWSIKENYLIVVDVLKNSSAAREGIKVGDCITAINGVKTIAANSDQLATQMNQVTSSQMVCEVRRKDSVRKVTLQFEEINIEPFTYKVIGETLYIKFHTIKKGTSEALNCVIQERMASPTNGIILDLRNLDTNQMEEIRKISDLFLEEGIAFKVQTKSDGVITYTTHEGAYDVPLIVITNKTTKRGAEALVLALEEKADIIGSDTSGDAYTQKIITLEDGSGMSVANGYIVDRYGKVLSKEGIAPDERLYITEKEHVSLFEKGYIPEEDDSYLQKALSKLA